MRAMTGGGGSGSFFAQSRNKTVFGLPGRQNDWLYNAFYDHQENSALSTRGTSKARRIWDLAMLWPAIRPQYSTLFRGRAFSMQRPRCQRHTHLTQS